MVVSAVTDITDLIGSGCTAIRRPTADSEIDIAVARNQRDEALRVSHPLGRVTATDRRVAGYGIT